MVKLTAAFGGTDIADKVVNQDSITRAIEDIGRFLNNDAVLPVRTMKLRHIRKIIRDMVEIGEIRQGSAKYDILNSYHRELFGVDAPYFTGETCVVERG